MNKELVAFSNNQEIAIAHFIGELKLMYGKMVAVDRSFTPKENILHELNIMVIDLHTVPSSLLFDLIKNNIKVNINIQRGEKNNFITFKLNSYPETHPFKGWEVEFHTTKNPDRDNSYYYGYMIISAHGDNVYLRRVQSILTREPNQHFSSMINYIRPDLKELIPYGIRNFKELGGEYGYFEHKGGLRKLNSLYKDCKQYYKGKAYEI